MSSLIQLFLQIQQQIRLYHWKTKSYARHVASGELYSKLDKLVDDFIETYQGKLGKSRIQYEEIDIKLLSIDDNDIIDVLNSFKDFLVNHLESFLSKNLKGMSNTDLLNKRDEMLGEVNRSLYLFSLN
jgi:hypothetical protein